MPARVLIFIVAYNAERTIQDVLRRILPRLSEHETEILIIDDSSGDHTFERAHEIEESPLPLTVVQPGEPGLRRKSEDRFPLRYPEKFDFVALLHGDGQYAPERLPDLLEPLCGRSRRSVRIAHDDPGGARRGGMPLYKWIGNKF